MMDLFCFPFAGGNSYSYRGLGDSFASVTVSTLELPGRGRRYAEPLLDRIDPMVEDLFRQLQPRLRQPYAFFGHSLGAHLAYLLAGRLSRAGLAPPRFLFVSGRKAPAVVQEDRRYLLPKDQFFAMLSEMGGCPPEILADAELMDLYEPILRADFSALASSRYEPSPPLAIPILVMIGADDDIAEEDALRWRQETTRDVRLVRFPGGHFFIFQQWREIRRLIADCLAPIHDGDRVDPWTSRC
jgi:surfactin synthase thioesterase subunit